MSDAACPPILVSEVGPRDGPQSIRRTMATADKCRWISALHAAGLREIEVGSFVSAALLPQMADVRELVRHALTLPGLHVAALAPNLRGAQAAFECGVHKLTVPVSVTEEHSLANVRKTRDEAIAVTRPGKGVRGGKCWPACLAGRIQSAMPPPPRLTHPSTQQCAPRAANR